MRQGGRRKRLERRLQEVPGSLPRWLTVAPVDPPKQVVQVKPATVHARVDPVRQRLETGLEIGLECSWFGTARSEVGHRMREPDLVVQRHAGESKLVQVENPNATSRNDQVIQAIVAVLPVRANAPEPVEPIR